MCIERTTRDILRSVPVVKRESWSMNGQEKATTELVFSIPLCILGCTRCFLLLCLPSDLCVDVCIN